MKFIEFFGSSHLNNKNVGCYEKGEQYLLKAENVVSGRILGSLDFDSYEAAESWFGNLEGDSNIQRLESALDILSE